MTFATITLSGSLINTKLIKSEDKANFCSANLIIDKAPSKGMVVKAFGKLADKLASFKGNVVVSGNLCMEPCEDIPGVRYIAFINISQIFPCCDDATVNQVSIVGRLGRDPESKYLSSGKNVCEVSLAVRSPNKEGTTSWFNCTAFDKTAAIIANYTTKGSVLGVSEGTFKWDSWQGDDCMQFKSKIIINKVALLPKSLGTNQNNDVQYNQNKTGGVPF